MRPVAARSSKLRGLENQAAPWRVLGLSGPCGGLDITGTEPQGLHGASGGFHLNRTGWTQSRCPDRRLDRARPARRWLASDPNPGRSPRGSFRPDGRQSLRHRRGLRHHPGDGRPSRGRYRRRAQGRSFACSSWSARPSRSSRRRLPRPGGFHALLERIGRGVFGLFADAYGTLVFLGHLLVGLGRSRSPIPAAYAGRRPSRSASGRASTPCRSSRPRPSSSAPWWRCWAPTCSPTSGPRSIRSS